MTDLFVLDDFSVDLDKDGTRVRLADSISLTVRRGETLCVVGESGSGKSVTFLSSVRLLEFSAPLVLSGSVRFEGRELLGLSQREMAGVRGRGIGLVFQEAMEALNPTKTIAAQLIEAYVVTHRENGGSRADREMLGEAARSAASLLEEVGMVDPDVVMRKYPHQLSGGMQQRVMIAMALIGDPAILIADEPTTALDVTVQAEILTLLKRLQRQRDMSCILITHDMGVASEVADRVAVMYAGQVVEVGPLKEVLASPLHAYSKALLECVPRPNKRLEGRMRSIRGGVPSPGHMPPGDRFAPRNPLATERDRSQSPPFRNLDGGRRMVRAWEPITEWTAEAIDSLTRDSQGVESRRATVTSEPVVTLASVSKTYGKVVRRTVGKSGVNAKWRPTREEGTRALRDIDLTVFAGEFFGIVGETGSGKSTLGKIIVDLEYADHGSQLEVAGFSLAQKRTFAAERELRKRVQMIFQNPQDSLDPRRTIGQAIAEPLHALTSLSRTETRTRVEEMIDAVGLAAGTIDKYPSEVSGGQRQRVAIARAIAPRPKVIVADEPTSALDVSVQGQILNLMLDLQAELGLTYVFITHNLSLITAVADRVGVMYRGELVEVATADDLLRGAQHPYTQSLLAANPDPFELPARQLP